MIYGYLRVSSDEQDVNSQKQGVEQFAAEKNWKIDKYITDEGVSGGKDPDKRNLGPLLKLVNKGDSIICSEISRLGRDLYMVMDILHFCMERECVVYTVKDKFTLGSDIQSKVLAFAFGLSAEIERQMIRQRTREGLRLRMKMGVLLGRSCLTDGEIAVHKLDSVKDRLKMQYELGVPVRRIAKNLNVDRNTVARAIVDFGFCDGDHDVGLKKAKREAERERIRMKGRAYKDEPWKVVQLDRDKMITSITADKTIPQIHIEDFPEYSYEQIYDTIACDVEFNRLYRKHGQLKIKKQKQ